MFCKICNLEVNERAHFWKNHKIKESDYYIKYEPRYDLLTGELIPFKSPENYQYTNFISRTNLKKYLENISKSDGIKYLTQWMINRKLSKNLKYAYGEFEIKTLQYPSIKYLNNYYGQNTYKNICNEAGLILKYKYDAPPTFNQTPSEILVDTREQIPFIKLEWPVTISTLNFADYCPSPNPYNIFIERKELTDWCGVMSKSYDRFKNELNRARENSAYIIILIESKYSDLNSINYLPQTKWVKASSEFLLKRARDLYLEFDNFQMVAGGTRKECIQLFQKLVKLDNIKQFDLQYLVNNGLI